MVIATLNDKKSYDDDTKQNLHFKQLQLNYINKQKHIRLVIVSVEIDAVAKIDDEVYVLRIIKIYSYFSFACLSKTAITNRNKM